MSGSSLRSSAGWLFAAGALSVVLVACGGEAGGPWASEAEAFFAGWAEAVSSGDVHDAVRYYEPEVAVRLAQTDIELTNPAAGADHITNGDGRLWLADWMQVHNRPRQRTAHAVFVDDAGAGVIVTVPELGIAALYRMEMTATGIAGQTTLRWRDAQKRTGAPDPRLAWVDDLVAAHLTAWEQGNREMLTDLYVDGAQVAGVGITPVTAVRGVEELRLPASRLSEVTAGDITGPAVFVAPDRNTDTVVFVVEIAPAECAQRILVSLALDERRITSERRAVEPTGVRECGDAPAGGWWTGLVAGPPLEERRTGTVIGENGEIEIYNGSARLESLLTWGLDRFAAAGLESPELRTATFGPAPSCNGRPGAVTENGTGGPDLVLCTDAHSACFPSSAECGGFTTAARQALLHELAHAWILANTGEETQRDFLALNSLTEWDGTTVAWHLRGVEHAADTIAWGLMDEPVALVRIGDPSCEVATAGFALLTGSLPATPCT